MKVQRQVATVMPKICVFPTEIGWMGLAGCGRQIERLVFGHSSADAVWERVIAEAGPDFEESNWFSDLRERLESYARGEWVDFAEFEVALAHLTPFQHRVVGELRKVPYGETVTYQELAARAGSPKAARAVGSVMAQNRVPLVVPCHRVVGSGGQLGGFSAPRGVTLKQELLEMERRLQESLV